jgi:hypothetical protein
MWGRVAGRVGAQKGEFILKPALRSVFHTATPYRLVFGADDPKRAGRLSAACRHFDARGLNHRVKVTGGIVDEDCASVFPGKAQ